MTNLTSLNAEALQISEEIENKLELLRSEKRKLIAIEDFIIENKEKLRSLKEAIRLKELATDFRSMIDENRELEIATFKERLPLFLEVK